MSEPLLAIRNNHSVSCGDPPIVNSEEDGTTYVGYFENAFGEQWIFTFDRGKNVASLRGGDLGWNTQLNVECDSDGVFWTKPLQVNLTHHERQWLLACWQAATTAHQ